MKCYAINAFTSCAEGGNPAAVCLLDVSKPDDWMQALAAHYNFSETAFVELKDSPSIRWFTPTCEVNLCGHATLAAASILFEQEFMAVNQISFQSKSGTLRVLKQAPYFTLDFPLMPCTKMEMDPRLSESLGCPILFQGKGGEDYLVEVEDDHTVRNLNPDFDLLKAFNVRGLSVSAKDSTGQYDFISRFFAPRSGISEDPVTGSAHCSLYPYWKERLQKGDLFAHQASERGGELRLSAKDDRIFISGEVYRVGERSIPAHLIDS